MRSILIIMLMSLCATINIQAQDDPEYRMEIGAGAGLTGYLGDFNNNLTHNLQPMLTVLGRYVMNPYMALRMNVSYGKMKGSSKGLRTRDYRGAKRLTPFVFGGIGTTYVDKKNGGKLTLNVPIGIGAKYKFSDRVNIGLEWAIHFTQSDELDGVRDPYLIKSSGLFKNTDCYSALQLTLTYSFMAKCKTCNRE